MEHLDDHCGPVPDAPQYLQPPQLDMPGRPDTLSNLTVTRSGWIKKRQNTSPRWVQASVVVFAILNIILEASTFHGYQ